MNATIERFAKYGISFWHDGDELLFDAPLGSLNAELLADLRRGRGEILSALLVDEADHASPAIAAARSPACSPHNAPSEYVDTPAPGGLIRTTCRVCGRFVGYRSRPHVRKGKPR